MSAVLRRVCVFVIVACLAGICQADVIGIDARHGYDADSVQATGSKFDVFRSTITGLGHTIVAKSSFEASDLVGLDALILKQAYSQNGPGYSASEISAIQAFVAAGGGLMIHGEGGPGSDERTDNLDTLVAPYGVVYSSTATEGSGYTIAGFLPHPLTEGVGSFGVDYQRRIISISSPAIDLTLGSGADDALAVVNGTGGHGNVVLLTDSSMWMDPDAGSDRPITFGDNLQLLKNAIGFIPEPATLSLLALGGLAMLRRQR